MIIEEGEGGEAVDQLQLKHGKVVLDSILRIGVTFLETLHVNSNPRPQ